MNFYNDLKEQVYKGIRLNPFIIMHSTVDWRKKDILNTKSSDVVLECQVSHNWSGSLGLMVKIIGATLYKAENPTLPPYVIPTQRPSSPSLPANPTEAQILTLRGGDS